MKYIPYKLPSALVVEKLVTVHYFEFSKNFYYPPESHDFWELHYVDKGSVISISEGEKFSLSQGDILFHKPMCEHQLVLDEKSIPNVCVISFYCKPKDMPFLEKKRMHLSSKEREIMKKLLEEAANTFDLSKSDPAAKGLIPKENAPFGATQMLKIRLEELLLLLARDYDNPRTKSASFSISDQYSDPIVRNMIEFMHDNVTKNLTLSDFCRQFNYGKTFLCTRFSKSTGKTINSYFIEMKIDLAKHMIREQDGSRELFTHISDTLGFSSPTYFYYTFKKLTKMTPSQYFKSVHQYDFDPT
jgi:AraC-like DNA-binding protein